MTKKNTHTLHVDSALATQLMEYTFAKHKKLHGLIRAEAETAIRTYLGTASENIPKDFLRVCPTDKTALLIFRKQPEIPINTELLENNMSLRESITTWVIVRAVCLKCGFIIVEELTDGGYVEREMLDNTIPTPEE